MPRPITRAPVDGKCRVCGSTEFGTRNRCKPCRAKGAREERLLNTEEQRARERLRRRVWRKANPDKARAQDRRKNYGVDAPEFHAMLVRQGQRCAVCRESDPNCLDHCHATGKFRGVLCRKCNAGLGQFRDDPSLLRAAARYVEKHRTRAAWR